MRPSWKHKVTQRLWCDRYAVPYIVCHLILEAINKILISHFQAFNVIYVPRMCNAAADALTNSTARLSPLRNGFLVEMKTSLIYAFFMMTSRYCASWQMLMCSKTQRSMRTSKKRNYMMQPVKVKEISSLRVWYHWRNCMTYKISFRDLPMLRSTIPHCCTNKLTWE